MIASATRLLPLTNHQRSDSRLLSTVSTAPLSTPSLVPSCQTTKHDFLIPNSQLAQRRHRTLRIILRVLDQRTHGAEIRILRIAQQLKQHTLASSDDCTLVREARQGNRALELVAAGDAVGEDVDPVAAAQQIEGGLRHADVRLDADEDDGELVVRRRGADDLRDFGHHHAEHRLVDFRQRRGLVGEERRHFRDGRA